MPSRFRVTLVFLALLVSGAALTVHAQQTTTMPRVGVLSPENPPPGFLEALQDGLQELGYAEGRNLSFAVRNGAGKRERLAAMADELVRLNMNVIVTVNTSAAQAAQKATTTIPIVITRVADPVKSGLAASLSHPGGNVTGLSFAPDEAVAKQLQFMKEIIPRAARVGYLWHADNPGGDIVLRAVERASVTLGLQLLRLPVRGESDLAGAVQAAMAGRVGALLVNDDAAITKHRVEFFAIAAKHGLPPVASFYKDFAEAGGLVAYGASPVAMYRRAAYFVDRILKGAKPRDLPIEQPTKFDLVINLKTAKALGLTIPPSLLARADQVIE